MPVGLTAAESPGLDGRRDGQVGLPRRIDGKEAILTFAGAGRFDAFEIAEGHVEQAALAAVHGRKCEGHAGLADLVCRSLSLETQLLRAEGFEIGSVEADEVVLALVEAQHLRGDCFQCAEQFTIVLGDERDIRPPQLDIDLAGLNAFRIAGAVSGSDAVFEAQTTPLIEDGEKSSYFLCSFLQVGNRHNGLVSQS
jgi:hypothetical protein